ncbi:hypothetical protein GGI07_001536 [Coemansia sp. Benny D115]|nr:hypothetical protein GGI07_001536 [Coemansia sp. Benny D115]
MGHSKSQQQPRRGNGSHKRRSPLHQPQQQQQEPEEFPPLNEIGGYGIATQGGSTGAVPPPYSPTDGGMYQAYAQGPAQAPLQPQAQGIAQVTVVPGGLVSLSPDEYYHPASFPGYTVVQLANGDESQALLPRGAAGRRSGSSRRGSQSAQPRRLYIRRRSRGCCSRFCGLLFSCVCFILGAFIVGVFIGAILFVSRHAFPPAWEWQCPETGLRVHTDQRYSFAADATRGLRIESAEGISVSNVHIARGSEDGSQDVTVHAVVETSKGALAGGISVVRGDRSLVIRAEKPRWEWPRDCVRATIFVTMPGQAAASDGTGVLSELHIATGAGTLRSLDAGELALRDLHVLMRDGSVQLRGLGLQGAVRVLTSNGRINATRVVSVAGSAEFVSSNAALEISGIQAQSVQVSTTNGAIRAFDVRSEGGILLHTSNAPVVVRGVSAAHGIEVKTSNGGIHGDLLSEHGPVNVVTANAAVGVDIDGRGGELGHVNVQSSNSAVSAVLGGVHGWFDARTSNGRVNLEAASNMIKLKHNTVVRKSGYYGDKAVGNITIATTNALVRLKFAE